MSLTIVADDLTGACDTGSLFAGEGPVPLAIWPAAPIRAAVSVVDTESRAAGADDAVARVARVPALAPATRYFAKIDSTLRGHVGLEVDALMRAAGLTTALVCPAFPAQGRVVIERLLLVDGVPLAATPTGRSAAASSSSVVDVLRARIDRPLAWIPLDQVRAGAARLTPRIGRLAGTVIVADAETDADLETLVDAALGSGIAMLLAGSAGLGRALACHLSLLRENVELSPGGRWLLVAGSRHPATCAQVAAARAAGLCVIAAPDAPADDRHAVARRLAAEARTLLERESFDGVAVTGGETARALCEALGADAIELIGPPRHGLALARLSTPRHPALPLLTKAGGFGEPDLFVSMLLAVAARGSA
ncbi:MAG TPA: four-carbon acid sugar kinase family protein [Candidatus Acidoferrum sp.]|nr:four-carbon acid sugar kinase family protein [Candidatus Acidoferrum sp.]